MHHDIGMTDFRETGNTSSGESRSTGYAIVQRIKRAFSTRREHPPYENSRQLPSQGNRPSTPPPDYDDPNYETVIGESVTGSHYKSISSYWNSLRSRIILQRTNDPLIPEKKGCQKCPCNREVSCVLLLLLFLCIGLIPTVVILSMNEKSTLTGDDAEKSTLKGDDAGIPDIRACENQYTMNISESRTIQCSLMNISIGVNDTAFMRKTNMQDSETNTRMLISHAENLKENMIVTFTLMDAVCSDGGNYSISLNTSNSIQDIHHFIIDIEDSPETPRITKQPNTRGYIAGEVLHLQCKAIVGCSMKTFEIQRKPKNINIYQNLKKGIGNYTQIKTDLDEYEVTLEFNTTLTDQSDGDTFICGVQGTKRTSEAYTVSTVPVDFCKNKPINCDYRHPTQCDMWVVCQTKDHPTIQPCHASFYYRPATDCTCCTNHRCVHPDEAECPYE